MATIKLHKDYLKNELDLPSSAVLDEITDTSRWSVHHRIIFKHDGKFYEAYYSEGATEMQDERPWEYEDEVECDEVELKEVKVVKWVKV
ncbi:hypothetical protein [Lysinibacillus sp. BPa_S21]|uniref:hypothetical protein n=1 Tax=Lysinibacillus sp. BPa_S21 TaxID=2932478 RepID=UPI00201314B9|nr:hypothetical protein [Lysinibacillus sp. BPa_S21]MCL1696387.1 hypothetical protein [Lysinibacillus sp. BPa_S21]